MPTRDGFLCSSCLRVTAMQGLITQPSDKAAPTSDAHVVSLASAMDHGLYTLWTSRVFLGAEKSSLLNNWAGCRSVSPIYLGIGVLEEGLLGGDQGPTDIT